MIKHILAFLLVSLSTIAMGQIKLTPKQHAKLDQIATQDVPSGAPGIATAIIADGKLLYERYAGFEQLEDSLTINQASRFNLASNGKQFTALAILLLEEQGKLKLSDDIRTYFPMLYPNISSKITIQHLLQHTSGIRDVYDLWSLQGITWWRNTYDNEDSLALIQAQDELNFTPGTKYLYSNSNYILLAELIERVTKTSFVDYTNKIFSQLNMKNTSFENNYLDIQGPIAKAYFNFDTWSTYDWKWNVTGDGNFFSTLLDQIEWEKIVQGCGNSNISKVIINKSQQREQLDTEIPYGYGLEFGSYKDIPYRFHEGATGAWKATVVRFDEPKISFITMTNSGKTIPSYQTRQMIDVVLDLESTSATYETEPNKIGNYISEEEILGTYLTPNNFSFEFKEKEDGSLILDRIGRGEVELEREAANIFRQKYDPAFKQEFTKNEQGEMMVTAYYTTHAPYNLTRTDTNWDTYDFSLLNGTYKNTETDVTLTIRYDEEQEYTVNRDGKEYKGRLVTLTKLLVNNYVIEFDIEDKVISTLFLSANRIERVRFERI
ncbi:hypothetical protein GCM10009117_10040 [Gangjinia marincola]|uniref:Beta-lactamase-related domain-containing protein n=1 Tax=Gangjinia marincola TaxID=578463 RepID=A0ABN1MGC3_9FLAO